AAVVGASAWLGLRGVGHPAQPPPAAAAPAPANPAPAMNSARAAINAALEAARAASGQRVAPKRPGADAPPAAPAPSAPPASGPAAPARPINVGPGATPGPGARMAPPPAPSAPAAGPRQGGTPPWEQPGAQAQARQQPQSQSQSNANANSMADDEPPSWVTDFSDDTAVAAETNTVAAPVNVPAPARAPAAPPHAYVVTPVPGLDWDGNWPALAATLPLRGVSQQLALQTELVDCHAEGAAAVFRLRVPVDTLRASGNSEKLQAALQDCFPGKRITVETEIGPVWYTAGAEAKAAREERQRQAEALVAGDPFVQEMERTLGAFVVPGSVKPPAA
ncbi:DNA polymerase III subunit gamma/tau, partial [Massilia sp. SYSU DXS3249]